MQLRTRWLTVGIVLGVGLLVACVLWFPRLLLTADVGRHRVATMDAEMAAKAINDVRTTLLQGLGGGVLLLGAFFTWQQLRVTREGQVTDLYTKAIDQLDAAKALPVRVGGLHALERIARDSRVDQRMIAIVLCAYARTAMRKEPPTPERGLAERAADVQAALTILARWRRDLNEDPRWLDLHGAEYQGARLHHAQLRGVQLFDAQLQGARLNNADLQDANLWQAQLQGAFLVDAQLQRAELGKAQLQGANLWRADLQGAHLNDAQLQGAELGKAQLQSATATLATGWPEGWDRTRAEQAGVQFVDDRERPLP
jgi:Pentapeptide repeats (8 copies)